MRNLLTTLFVLLSSAMFAQPGDKNFIDMNYIEVTGKSEMEVTPDLIYLKVQLNEKDTKNKVSVSELEAQMFEKLKGIGIDLSKDLVIKDISSHFKDYLLSHTDILLSKEYQVLVHNGKAASQVFLELEKIGISNVSVDHLDNSNIVGFRKEVKINAIKAAKEKAESLAVAIDQSIGRALYIQELDNTMNFDRNANSIKIRGYSGSFKAESADLDFEFEKIKLEYSILCRFELK